MASSVANSVRERAFAPTAPLSATSSAATPSIVAVPPRTTPPLRICHVMSADLWAGAEVQLATMAGYLTAQPDMDVSFVLFNDGRLAKELRALGLPVTVIDETRLGPVAMVTQLTKLLASRPFDVVHTHRYKDTVVGTMAAAQDPLRHVVWIQVGIARGAAECLLGLVCLLRGTVTFPQAGFGIIVAGLVAIAYVVLYPRAEPLPDESAPMAAPSA